MHFVFLKYYYLHLIAINQQYSYIIEKYNAYNSFLNLSLNDDTLQYYNNFK